MPLREVRLGKLIWIFGFVCVGSFFLISLPARAQDASKVDVFAGYSYLNVDTNNANVQPLGITSRQSANGWESSASGSVYKWLAAEADFSGYYKTYPVDLSSFGLGTVDVDVRDYGFLGGPRVNLGPAFIHGLVGADRLTGSAMGASESQDSFAAAFGGGLQVPVAPRFAIRASADYVLTRHNIFKIVDSTLPNYTQNNFRASIGIVFRFGTSGGTGSHVSDEPRSVASGNEEAPLLGVAGYERSDGFFVVSVRALSAAAAAGIRPGDIVMSMDARPVQSSRDIEAAIATSQTGIVKVMYFRDGVLQMEAEVKVR